MMTEIANPETLSLIGSGVRRIVGMAKAEKAVQTRYAAGVAVVTDRAAFDALLPEWAQLEQTASSTTLFQSSAWCRAVYDHHESTGRAFEPMVLTLRERGRLLALLPLQRVAFGLARIITGFGEPYQQYTEIMLAADAPENATARLLEAAFNLPSCDGVSLLKVRDDSPLARLLREKNAIRSNEDAAPFVDLRPHREYSSYHSTRNAKTRKNMRNVRNRVARMGRLEHRVVTEDVQVQELVARAHCGRERWLEEQGLTSRAFRDPTFGSFAARVASPQSGLQIRAMSLTIDGAPAADQWGFVFNDRYYAYVATWQPEFEEASPGKLHLEEVIRACHEQGLKVVDLLMPAARYKFTWTDQAVTVADYAVPLAVTAQLQFSLWSGKLRPWLKRTALRVPAGLRSRVANVLLRR
jgi:CelD/BcsL family acetyltransferase involved in cellulose biosynthesis